MSEENQEIPENVPVLGPEPVRENLVATAVKFLQNPKVQSSPLDKKKEFLKKKGLTDEEINKAVDLAGVATIAPPSQAVLHTPPSQVVSLPPQQVSTWSRIRDYSSLAIVIGGVIYGLYSLFKKYIEPMFLRRHKEQDEKLSRMEKGINDLQSGVVKNMEELKSTIKKLREQLDEQNLKISNVSTNLMLYKDSASAGGSTHTLSNLQAEIASVKGILLSTKQFPAAPVVPPVIPSWQMDTKKTSTSKLSDETSNSDENGDHDVTESGDGRKLENEKPNSLLAAAGKVQTRNDLEKRASDDESSESGDENRVADDFSSKINGQNSLNSVAENGLNGSPTAINGGLITNRSGAMLVSPTKLANLQPSANADVQPVGGESELD